MRGVVGFMMMFWREADLFRLDFLWDVLAILGLINTESRKLVIMKRLNDWNDTGCQI